MLRYYSWQQVIFFKLCLNMPEYSNILKICEICNIFVIMLCRSISGPVILLQMWSWTRLPIGRPGRRENVPDPEWGLPDEATCPAFGQMWASAHRWHGTPHGGSSGVSHYRDALQNMTDSRVEWRPYAGLFNQFPRETVVDHRRCLVRTPLIHFWIVEWHYPERVMRQFDLYQRETAIPLPISERETRELHE